MIANTCSIDGCDGKHEGNGFCRAHYRRFKKYGDPLGGRASIGDAQRFYEEIVINYDGDECLMWPYMKSGGYGRLGVWPNRFLVHRLVCETVNAPPPTTTHQAAHSCGNRGCVAKKHIRWATPVENSADRELHGTSLFGAKHPSAKLTEKQVRQIRSLRGVKSQSLLASEYGVAKRTIHCIQKGKLWPRLDEVNDAASARILPADPPPGVDLKALIKKLQRVKGGE